MTYDAQNIFAKILRKEIPCTVLYENDFALAFHDIHPKAPIHVLVIPKGPYENAHTFYGQAPEALQVSFAKALAHVVDLLELPQGYRLIANCGLHGGQEVPHFHMHILGGHALGPMVITHA